MPHRATTGARRTEGPCASSSAAALPPATTARLRDARALVEETPSTCNCCRMSGVLQHPRGALFGAAGPVLFFVGVILVSWSERDFMAELGWEHWPSGTRARPSRLGDGAGLPAHGRLPDPVFGGASRAGRCRHRPEARRDAPACLRPRHGAAGVQDQSPRRRSQLARVDPRRRLLHVPRLPVARLRCAGLGIVGPTRSLLLALCPARVDALARSPRASGRPREEQLHVLRGSVHASARAGDPRSRDGRLAASRRTGRIS